MKKDQAIHPKDLEKILKILPEPTAVRICLKGRFDYSDISRQVRSLIPTINLDLNPNDSLTADIKNPSRKKY